MVADFSILLAYSDLWLSIALVALWRISLRVAPPVEMDTDASRLEDEFRDVLQNKGFGKLMVYVVEVFNVSASAEWSVSESDSWLAHQEAEAKGFVRPIHPSFGNYYVTHIKWLN
jgi:hypothetical protein